MIACFPTNAFSSSSPAIGLSLPLDITDGGTGAETAAFARVNLGTETVVPGVAQVITLTIESTPSSEWAGLYIDIYDGAGVCRFWVMQSGSGDAPPTPFGGRLQLVNVEGFDIIDVETAFLVALSAQSSAFSASGSGTGLITVTNVFAAAAPPPAQSSPPLPIITSVSTLGEESYRQLPSMDGSKLTNINARQLGGYTSDDFSLSTHLHDDRYPTSLTSGITGADRVTNIVSLTQAEYDALGSKSASTLYIIA